MEDIIMVTCSGNVVERRDLHPVRREGEQWVERWEVLVNGVPACVKVSRRVIVHRTWHHLDCGTVESVYLGADARRGYELLGGG